MEVVSRVNVPTPGVEVVTGGGVAAAPGWWDPLGAGLCVWSAYQPKGAASFAASLLDLTGNGNHAVDPGGAGTPAWNAVNGWIFDGIATYLDTLFVSQNDQSQSVLIQFTNTPTAGDSMFGVRENGDVFHIFGQSAGGVAYRHGAAPTVFVAPNLAVGNLAIAGNQGYRNGVAEGAALPGYGGGTGRACLIGARMRGVPQNFCGYDCSAFALYDCTLTAPQVLSVAAAMALL